MRRDRRADPSRACLARLTSQVDMLLLAGDLFHENRPSRTSLYQTISAMRERCLSDRPISLEVVSDAGVGIARDAR